MRFFMNLLDKYLKAQLTTPEKGQSYLDPRQVKPDVNSVDPNTQVAPGMDPNNTMPNGTAISPAGDNLTGTPPVSLTPDGPAGIAAPPMQAPVPVSESVQTAVPMTKTDPQNRTMDMSELEELNPRLSQNLRKFGVLTVDRAIFTETYKSLQREASLKRISLSDYLDGKR